MIGAIFDLGGVVVDWSNQTTYRYIEKEYGIPEIMFKGEVEREMPLVQTGMLPEEQWMREAFRRFGVDVSGDVWGTTFEAARYNGDVLGIIGRLRRNGYKVAALSNLEPSRAKWLRRHGIDKIFDEVVFSCDVGFRKPDLQPGSERNLHVYQLTLERLNLRSGDCVFVDDNVNCVAAAESLGIVGVLFSNAPQLEADLKELEFEIG